jgi:hypothetical protein
MNMSERLERMARKADAIAADLTVRATTLLRDRESGAHRAAGHAMAFFNIAAVLRAGIDPADPMREEKIGG